MRNYVWWRVACYRASIVSKTTRVTKNTIIESQSTSKMSYRCSLCKQLGHNIRWCPRYENQQTTTEGSGLWPQEWKRANHKFREVLGICKYAHKTFIMNLVNLFISNWCEVSYSAKYGANLQTSNANLKMQIGRWLFRHHFLAFTLQPWFSCFEDLS